MIVNPILTIQVAIVAIAVTLTGYFLYRRSKGYLCLANIAEGTHAGALSKKTDAAIATRHLLFKVGSDINHIVVCGANAIPLGTVPNEAGAAEALVQVNLLGIYPATVTMVASEAIVAGVHVYTAASGKIQDLPVGAGTYYEVGIALNASGADGDLIEVQHCVPRKVVVP